MFKLHLHFKARIVAFHTFYMLGLYPAAEDIVSCMVWEAEELRRIAAGIRRQAGSPE
jgi:hypothetical protein